MSTIELKKMIYAFLRTKASKVYPSDSMPENATLPYTTYGLTSSFTDENQKLEVFSLFVDNWDNNPDTTALETVTGSIDGDGSITGATGLHRKRYYTSGTLLASIYREARLEIEDEDPAIRRRRLRYEVQAYLS